MTEQPPGTPGDSGISELFRPGSQIAGYRLEERIGRGGMAVVFRAHDPRLDRQVALKILAPALASDESFRQRFIRESRAAAAVDDPHIIPVFEAGEADSVLFIAMRYVRGGDVRSLIDRIGPLPAGRAAEIVSQAASALDAAHARGLVHRDVKPANMLLEASVSADRPEHLYLSDFGLSKASLATSALTATGQFLGTLDYVAPEQIEGRPLDGRTDEYGLACSAFEMLAGEPPFRRSDGGLSVMYAHLSEPPPLLRLRRPELPAEVDQVMARALAKSPDDRYPTCREFAAALRFVLGLGASSPRSPADAHPATQIALPAVTGSGRPAGGGLGGAGLPGADQPGSEQPGGDQPAGDRAGRGEPARPAVNEPAAAMTEPRLLVPPGTRAHSRPGGSGAGQADGAGRPRPVRPWWRSLPVLAGVCAVAVAVVVAFALTGGGHGKTGGTTHDTVAAALTVPGCTTKTAPGTNLAGVSTALSDAGSAPFGVAVTPDGKYSFVSGGNAVQLLRNAATGRAALVRTISVPGATKGDAMTANGQFLLAATHSGAAIINIAEAVQGAPDPVSGTLTSPQGSDATEVLITADENYALVSLQSNTMVAVFNLKQALTQGVSSADFIGDIPVPANPVGLATDGTWLYIASLKGYLTVASLSQAEKNPARAVVATVLAGCQPARALVSADHQLVWVTDRGGDYLLGFSAARLRSSPQHALVAKVMVGEAPIGETFIDGGSKIVVADSNLNNVAGPQASVAVISTASALAGKPALLGYLPTGDLPHEFAVEPDGRTLLVTLQNAHQLEAVTIRDLQ